MAVRTLASRTSLGAILPEITYTRSRLKAHPLGAPHVAAFDALRAEWTQVHAKELTLREGIVDAQALVDHVDDLLDVFVRKAVKVILSAAGDDRSHPLYKHFLGNKTPSDFVRPVLGGQLEAMRGWVISFQNSDDPSLQALAPELASLVEKADMAAKARALAEQERDQFRDLGERQKFMDKLNAERKAAHGGLSKLPHEKAGLPNNFADRFFRREARPEPGEEEAPTIASVKASIAAMEAQLGEQKALLGELEAEQAKANEAEVAADQAALAALEKQMAEQAAQAAALRAKIEGKTK
jgi:hypothetical protein